jgi:alpha-D-ribose 1-methylphosphonate 5-phosphate C-P lyase
VTASRTANRTHVCALCGKRMLAEHMVYSTHTRNRYCADTQACNKRYRRGNQRKETTT